MPKKVKWMATIGTHKDIKGFIFRKTLKEMQRSLQRKYLRQGYKLIGRIIKLKTDLILSPKKYD